MKKLIIILTLLFSCSIFASTFKAPNIVGKDQYNVEQSLENYKGKYVILIFWATWCPACKEELYSIDSLYKTYGENKKDIVFLVVSNENKEEVANFLNSKKHIFPTIISEQAYKEYAIKAFPTMFIIDKDGNILNYVVGAVPKATLEKYINVNLLQKSF